MNKPRESEEEPLQKLQARGREAVRQATFLATRFGVPSSEVVRMAIAKLYMEVLDNDEQKT